jgi:hypothetical protein
MELEDEIISRIRAAKGWDKDAKIGDFQFRAFDNGSVLVNIKTGKAQLVYDDESVLHDLDDLLPRKDVIQKADRLVPSGRIL